MDSILQWVTANGGPLVVVGAILTIILTAKKIIKGDTSTTVIVQATPNEQQNVKSPLDDTTVQTKLHRQGVSQMEHKNSNASVFELPQCPEERLADVAALIQKRFRMCDLQVLCSRSIKFGGYDDIVPPGMLFKGAIEAVLIAANKGDKFGKFMKACAKENKPFEREIHELFC